MNIAWMSTAAIVWCSQKPTAGADEVACRQIRTSEWVLCSTATSTKGRPPLLCALESLLRIVITTYGTIATTFMAALAGRRDERTTDGVAEHVLRKLPCEFCTQALWDLHLEHSGRGKG